MGKIGFLYEKEDNKEVFCVCQELLVQKGHEVTLFQYNNNMQMGVLQEVELLICSNLTAFDVRTLTGGRSLNLITSKVYHLITKRKCGNEEYLKDLISIAHFFFCTEEERMEKMKKAYPHIPYIELLEGWSGEAKTDGALLADSICKVLDMCYIN